MKRVRLIFFILIVLLAACGGANGNNENSNNPDNNIVNNDQSNNNNAQEDVDDPESPTEVVAAVTATATPVGPYAAIDPTPVVLPEYPGPTETPNPKLLTYFYLLPGQSLAKYSAHTELFEGALDEFGLDLGFDVFEGRTSEVSGGFYMDMSVLPAVIYENEFIVDLSTLISDDDARDQSIRDAWLESLDYPQAKFVAVEIRDFPDDEIPKPPIRFNLVGTLTIRDITQPIGFAIEAEYDGQYIIGLATATIRMSDFGFEAPTIDGVLTVGDEVAITMLISGFAVR